VNITVITAGAGSGKTTRLTELLETACAQDRLDPERLVAMTFTRQAAAELVERIRERLLRSGAGELAHRVLAARIGTVHAVCGTLVVEHAFELGLSPSLRVLDEVAAGIELEHALARVVRPATADALQDFRQRFDPQLDWTLEVRRLIEAARANGLDAAALGRCAGHSVAALDACLGACEDAGEPIDRALLAAIDQALAAIDPVVDSKQNTSRYIGFLRRCRDQLIAHGHMRWGDWARLCGSIAPSIRSAAHAAPVAAAARRHLGHPHLRRDLQRYIELFFQVAADGLDAYQEHKRACGVLDYTDQEALALALLRRDDIRDRLRGRFQLVLIDEFQDTSPLQLAIFLELARLADRSVWVGDPKQAIYGFRGTDPQLMDAAIEALDWPASDGDLVGAMVSALQRAAPSEILATSYRSRPGLVQFTSELFARAFAHHGLPPERTRLAPARSTEPAGLGPFLEHWLLHPEKPSQRTLAACLAAGIRDLLDRAPLVRSRGGDGTRPVRPGDVAVLCRTNAQCQAVAEALAGLGVAAILPRTGLLDTAEAQLVQAGLRLWLDPDDALAAAEIARLLSHPRDLDALARRALACPGAAAFAEEPAVARLRAARQQHADSHLLAAFDRILAATSVREHCAAWGHSAQRSANLDALRAHAVTYLEEAAARRAPASLAGFLAHLEELRATTGAGWNTARRDTQALLGADDQAVAISTWHAAKGREWPIVILSGLETLQPPACHGTHIVSERDTVDLADPLAGRWLLLRPNPYTTANQGGPVKDAYQADPHFARLVERADREALRVLYVGWTRARDRLVLAAQRGKLLDGLLGVLTALEPGLLDEPPPTDAPATVHVTWAGHTLELWTSPTFPSAPLPVPPQPGSFITTPSAPRPHPPARLSPSACEPVPCTLGHGHQLGPRLPVQGDPDLEQLGRAIHAFLAIDDTAHPAVERHTLAAELLHRHGVSGHLDPAEVVRAGDRLWRWLHGQHSIQRLHREVPVAERLPGGTLVTGTADLVARCPDGFLLVDHKTFPGTQRIARERVLAHSGQLAAYARAITAATGDPCRGTWIHMPVLGTLVELRLGEGTST
jgi:ATP-dependent exoDNAse (exonuclease V) beta subunit